MNGVGASVVGLAQPSLRTIAQFHPNFALAVASGCEARPNLRTLQANFSSLAVGEFEDADFDDFIQSYSIFSGVTYTIDPTNAFNGNILKGLNDVTTSIVSGIVTEIRVRGRGDDYLPVPVNTPLQQIPTVLNPLAGIWKMDTSQSLRARFTINANITTTDGPITIWMVFSFLVLESSETARKYLCLSVNDARKQLAAMPGFGSALAP